MTYALVVWLREMVPTLFQTDMWLVSKRKGEMTFFETFLKQLGEMVFRTRVVRAVGMALLPAAVPPSWYHLVMVTCSNKVQVGVHQCTTDQLHCCRPPGHQDFIRPNSPTSKYRSSLYSSSSPTDTTINCTNSASTLLHTAITPGATHSIVCSLCTAFSSWVVGERLCGWWCGTSSRKNSTHSWDCSCSLE